LAAANCSGVVKLMGISSNESKGLANRYKPLQRYFQSLLHCTMGSIIGIIVALSTNILCGAQSVRIVLKIIGLPVTLWACRQWLLECPCTSLVRSAQSGLPLP
jgi:hypothetical protein